VLIIPLWGREKVTGRFRTEKGNGTTKLRVCTVLRILGSEAAHKKDEDSRIELAAPRWY
jgi:hypothetical protein